MSYSNGSYNNSRVPQTSDRARRHAPTTTSSDFDILDWHPAYESCQRYFLDHAQHEPGTQALCALINIRLPFQWLANPLHASTQPAAASAPSSSTTQAPASGSYNYSQWSHSSATPGGRANTGYAQSIPVFVSLVPYIRRLVITGFDKPGILHGFFGDAYVAGITPLQDCERRNYLFTAKHGGWRTCKKQYDMNSEETVPFLKPLHSVKDEELDAAEKSWSEWLAMEDWMVGPRAPADSDQDDELRAGQGNNFAHGGFGFDPSLPDGFVRS